MDLCHSVVAPEQRRASATDDGNTATALTPDHHRTSVSRGGFVHSGRPASPGDWLRARSARGPEARPIRGLSLNPRPTDS